MVGLIAKYGSKLVFVTAPSREAAEEIALQLFADCGYDLKGIEIPMILFDPTEIGGMILDPSVEDPFTISDDLSMKDWTLDGYMGPTDPDPSAG